MKDFLSENWLTMAFWLAVILIGGYFFGSDPEFWDAIFQGSR